MNRLPEWVRIKRGVKYRLLEAELEPETSGECDYDKRQVVISKRTDRKQRASVLLHEFIHAMSHEWDIGLTEPQVLKLEQAIVNLMSLNRSFSVQLLKVISTINLSTFNKLVKKYEP